MSTQDLPPDSQLGSGAQPSQPSMPDLFAEAVERLRAGESAAAVVASYPAAVQGEIRELLTIVELAEEVAVQPVPLPAPDRRQAARTQFLQQARTLQAQRERTAAAAGAGAAAPAASLRERLREGWRSIWDAPSLRLAPLLPLVAVVLAVTLGTFWTVQTAKAALPGDPAYPLKQWVRRQRVTLVAPAQQREAVSEAEAELAAETQTLAIARRDIADLVPPNTETMVYYGRRGDLVLFGPLRVAPNFQPDPNVEAYVAMRIDGDLEPGALVKLTYRVLPGFPNVVQGVNAEVLAPPQPVPAAALVSAPVSTPQSVPTREQPAGSPGSGVACTGEVPEGWVLYAVSPGDSLAGLAAASGVSPATIARVNCLSDGSPAGVSTLYLPPAVVVRVTPEAMPSPLPTWTPAAPTWTPEAPTWTPAAPTIEPTTAPTTVLTAEPTDAPTGAPTGAPPTATAESTPGDTPVSTPTPGTTAEPTVEPTGTPAATLEPTAVTTTEPTTQPTSEPTGAATDAATATSIATVAVTPQATPEATLPPVEPTVPPTVPPTAAPTEPPVTLEPAATRAPVEPPTPVPEPPTPEPPTPEPPPVVPTPRPDPPTPEPPVLDPPIVEPPTPVPDPPTPEPAPPDFVPPEQP